MTISPVWPAEADPIVWTLARQVWLDHAPDRDGFCPVCKEFAPCGPRESAGIALGLGCRVSWTLPD